MATRLTWQTPLLRTDEDENRERKATWLELFYDLVFVAVVAELAHSLAGDISWDGAGKFMLLFIPVWWVWIGGTYYNDRFELNDISHRIFTFAQMVPVAALAIYATDGLGDTSRGFALAYASARIIITFLWWRGGRYNPAARPVTNRYTIGFSISIALWIISIFVPTPWRFVLWGIGLAFDLLTPPSTLEHQKRLPRISRSHLPERFGLFTIIVLGESVIGAIAGVSEDHHFTLNEGVVGVLGLALAFSIWWIYFDQIADKPTRPGIWWGLSWTYLHLPLVIAITAAGVGVLNVVAHEPTDITTAGSWLIALPVAGALVTVGLLEAHQASRQAHLDYAVRFGGAAAVLILGLIGSTIGSVALMALVVTVLVIQIIQGIVSVGSSTEVPEPAVVA